MNTAHTRMAMKLNEFVNYFYAFFTIIHVVGYIGCGTQQPMKTKFIFAVDKKHPQLFWIWFNLNEFTGSQCAVASAIECIYVMILPRISTVLVCCDRRCALNCAERAIKSNTQKAERIQNAQVLNHRWVNSMCFSHILKNHYRVIYLQNCLYLLFDIGAVVAASWGVFQKIIDQSQNEYGIHVRIHTHTRVERIDYLHTRTQTHLSTTICIYWILYNWYSSFIALNCYFRLPPEASFFWRKLNVSTNWNEFNQIQIHFDFNFLSSDHRFNLLVATPLHSNLFIINFCEQKLYYVIHYTRSVCTYKSRFDESITTQQCFLNASDRLLYLIRSRIFTILYNR